MTQVNDQLRHEHDQVRNNVAYYDFTLDLLEVDGPDAAQLLDYVFVKDVKNVQDGDAVYTSVLDEDGYMIDDLITFKREGNKYWVTVAHLDAVKPHLENNIGDLDVTINDLSGTRAIYTVQGPNSGKVLNNLLEDPVDDLKTYKHFDTKTKDGVEVMVSRTGFTGELGYELHFASEDMEKVAAGLDEAGKEFNIEEIGAAEVTVGSLPVEKGFLQDIDFLGHNTVEVGLGWTVNNRDKDFIGKERTIKYLDEGPARKLLGFRLADNTIDVQQEDQVLVDGEVVGHVTRFVYGYTLESYLGYAFVDGKYDEGDKATIKNDNGEVEITFENKNFS